MNSFLRLMTCIAVFGFLFTSCTSDDSEEQAAGFGVKLVDAPGDYEKVLIDVRGIEAVVDGEHLEFAVAEPGIYDLLILTGGVTAQLLETEIPAGKLSQLRLILGQENAVIKNGDTIALKTPSAQQSGLKLNVHQDMEPGIFYEFVLDFNVDKSIVEAGSNLILKPVIRASLLAETGAVAGKIAPADVQAKVTAVQGDVEIGAYTSQETGAFLLYGVPAGTYEVTVTPDSISGLAPVVIEDVIVEDGETNDLGTISLE